MHFVPLNATRDELDTLITRAHDAMTWHRSENRATAAQYCEQQLNLMIDRRNQTPAPTPRGAGLPDQA